MSKRRDMERSNQLVDPTWKLEYMGEVIGDRYKRLTWQS